MDREQMRPARYFPASLRRPVSVIRGMLAVLLVPLLGGSATGSVTVLRPNTSVPDDVFGQTVALQGDRAAVGRYVTRSDATYVHVVDIFERSGSSWDEVATIESPPLAAFDDDEGQIGSPIALDGDVLVVGDSSDSVAGA